MDIDIDSQQDQIVMFEHSREKKKKDDVVWVYVSVQEIRSFYVGWYIM